MSGLWTVPGLPDGRMCILRRPTTARCLRWGGRTTSAAAAAAATTSPRAPSSEIVVLTRG